MRFSLNIPYPSDRSRPPPPSQIARYTEKREKRFSSPLGNPTLAHVSRTSSHGILSSVFTLKYVSSVMCRAHTCSWVQGPG